MNETQRIIDFNVEQIINFNAYFEKYTECNELEK